MTSRDVIADLKAEVQEQHKMLSAATDLVMEMEAMFDLRQKADMRAIKRWREAHPESKLTLPDQADLCVWLMGQIDELEAKIVQLNAEMEWQ